MTVELRPDHAEALAQLLKRITFLQVRESSIDDAEAYLMIEALERVREGLRDIGYAPR